jgi:hypothetical protein
MLVAQPWSRMPADGFIIDCIQGASINRAQTWQPPSSLYIDRQLCQHINQTDPQAAQAQKGY